MTVFIADVKDIALDLVLAGLPAPGQWRVVGIGRDGDSRAKRHLLADGGRNRSPTCLILLLKSMELSIGEHHIEGSHPVVKMFNLGRPDNRGNDSRLVE